MRCKLVAISRLRPMNNIRTVHSLGQVVRIRISANERFVF